MSTKELIKSLDRDDLRKLYEAKRFTAHASKNQHSLFSFKRIKALYMELALKYKVDFNQILLVLDDLDDGVMSEAIA